jgi:hypothetical protein
MYLIDTNIWLERMLNQEYAENVRLFLDQHPSDQLLITDFSFHSIGVVLCRLGHKEVFSLFVRDVLIDGAVSLVALNPDDMPFLIQVMDTFNLDFDDAYQYAVAERYAATIVSLDRDFDRTERGRITP